jgi:hypothetical protein
VQCHGVPPRHSDLEHDLQQFARNLAQINPAHLNLKDRARLRELLAELSELIEQRDDTWAF